MSKLTYDIAYDEGRQQLAAKNIHLNGNPYTTGIKPTLDMMVQSKIEKGLEEASKWKDVNWKGKLVPVTQDLWTT